jgi:site-specific DNA-methyltransferase (adenine-specific)
MARRPLERTVAYNVLVHGTGALNVDACRVPYASENDAAGRWPANVLHDGSDEVMALFPETGPAGSHLRHNASRTNTARGPEKANITSGHEDPGGSAARFFYCAKASTRERGAGNTHPTVKPIALATYLATLLLPPPRPDGQPRRLLVPFAGSGSEVIGALAAGWDEVVGIEREAEYVAIARRRVAEHAPAPVAAPVPVAVAASVPAPKPSRKAHAVGQLTFEGLA